MSSQNKKKQPNILNSQSRPQMKGKQPVHHSPKKNRVLALSMRPRSLNDLVGQEKLVESLQNQTSSGRMPHFFHSIRSCWSRKDHICTDSRQRTIVSSRHSRNQCRKQKRWDDIRELVEKMKYKPVYPSKYRVVILR